MSKIAFGCDHVGLSFKETLMRLADKLGHSTVDCGTYTEDRMNYPEIGFKVAELVSKKEMDKGVLICGTGVGMSIAANKVVGGRAVVCSDLFSAKMSRAHNDANILCLGERVLEIELACLIFETCLFI